MPAGGFYALVFTFFLTLFPHPTHAADSVQAALVAGIPDYLAQKGWRSAEAIIPQVTERGDVFALAFPEMTLISPQETRFTLPALYAALYPEESGSWRVSVTLPTQISGRHGASGLDFDLDMQEPRLVGLWSVDYQAFEHVSGGVSALQLLRADGQAVMAVDEITFASAPEEDSASDFASHFTARRVRFLTAGQQHVDRLSVGIVALRGQIADYDAARFAQVMAGFDPANPARLADFLPLFDSARLALSLRDVRFQEASDSLLLDSAVLRLHLHPEGADHLTARLDYGHDGLRLAPAPEPILPIPENLRLKLAATDVPLRHLWPDSQAIAETDSPFRLPAELLQHLANAETQLKLEHLTLRGAMLRLLGEGEARFDPAAQQGYTGEIRLTARGLDELAAHLSRQPPSQRTQDHLNNILALAVIQALGEKQQDEAGNLTRHYRLHLTQNGQFHLNGTDLSKLLQNLGR